MNLFLGIDLGTTYFKAGLFDENGTLQGLGRQFVKKDPDTNIICELSIDRFWSTLSTCIMQAISMANAKPKDIISISYSSQANSFCLFDKDLKPLTPLIIWTDKRAQDLGPEVKNIFSGKDSSYKTGLGIDPSGQLCIAKLLWFQAKQPLLWKVTRAIMTISDYLTFQLTGQRIGDCSTASLLGILDVQNCRWWSGAVGLLKLEESYLSKPFRIGTFAGLLSSTGASKLGLMPGIPVSLGGLDHHIAAIGAGVPGNDLISESTGTVLAAVKHTSEFLPQPQLCIAPGIAENHYFQMAFDDNGARSLEWYQREYARGLSIPELLEMAFQVSIGSDGLVAKPYAASYKNLEGFENIKPYHRHGHFVRAILESTALSLDTILEKLITAKTNEAIVATGGGAMSNLWIKIKADLSGKKFLVPECNETACLGAAMVGAAGTHKFNSLRAIGEQWIQFKETVYPDPDNHVKYHKWSQKIESV